MAEKKLVSKSSTVNEVEVNSEQTETIQLPKTPDQYSYRGDEDLIIKASEFLVFAEALEIAVQNGTDLYYPSKIKYIDSITEVEVPNPTEEEIRTRAVRAIMHIDATFDDDNLKQNYKSWLVPKVIDAKTSIFSIHARNVQEGRATELSVLQKEAQEANVARQAARNPVNTSES